MDIFKGADNPFALLQRASVSGWHSLTLVLYSTVLYMYLYYADSVTFKDIPPFIAVSGKDWGTSNLNDNLHVHVLYMYFLTYWPLFVIFWQLVVNSLMNTFFLPIEHTHHSNDCSNRGMECYFAMNNCLLTLLIAPLYANCLIECSFFTYDCPKMLLIFFWCFWLSIARV